MEEEYLSVWGSTIYFHPFALFHSCSLSTWSRAPCSFLCPAPHLPLGLRVSLHTVTPLKGPSLNPCHLEHRPLIAELRWLASFANLFGRLISSFWPPLCSFTSASIITLTNLPLNQTVRDVLFNWWGSFTGDSTTALICQDEWLLLHRDLVKASQVKIWKWGTAQFCPLKSVLLFCSLFCHAFGGRLVLGKEWSLDSGLWNTLLFR